MPFNVRVPPPTPITNIPLRWVLVVPFVVQTVGAVALVGYLSYRSGQQAVKTLAYQVMEGVGQQVTQELDHYLQSAQAFNQYQVAAIASGAIDLQNLDQVHRYLFLQHRQANDLTTLLLATPQGDLRISHRVSPEDYGITTQLQPGELPFEVSIAQPSAPGILHLHSVDDAGNLDRPLGTITNIDGRDRPWYRQAIATGTAGWTAPFQVGSTNLLALNAYAPIYDRENQVLGVFSVNISLNQLGGFLRDLDLGPSGEVFIIERNGLLIANSTAEASYSTLGKPDLDGLAEPGTLTFQRRSPRDLTNPAIQRAYADLTARFDQVGALQSPQFLSFSAQGDRYFLSVTPYSDDYGLDWLVVTVLPESDFMAEIHQNGRTTLLLCLLTLGGAIASGLAIARRVTTRMTRLHHVSQELASGQLSQRLPGDSSIAEVRGLAQAFNQMADQLQDSFDRLRHALDESEEKFTTVFRTSPDPIAITDMAAGRFLELNTRMVEFYGYCRADMVGRTAQELGLWVNQEERHQFRQRLESQGSVYNHEITTRLKSGEVRAVLISAEVCDLNGQAAVICTIRDISDRKQVEMALRQSELRLSTVFRDIPQPAWIATLSEGRCLEVNESFCKVLEYSHGEAVGKSCVEMQLWNDLQDLHHFRHALLETGQIQDFEVVFRTKSRQAKTVLLSARVSRLDGQDCVIGTLNDISDRKQIELSLQQALQELNHHVEHSPLATIRWNQEFRVEQWSEQAEQIFGWTAAEVMGKTMYEWQFIMEDDREKVQQCAVELLQGNTRICYNRNYHRDGSVVYCEWYNSILLNEQGHLVSILSLVQDVSDRHHSELERLQAEAALREGEERLRFALDAANMGSWDWNILSHQIIWSESLERLMGFAPGTFDGRFETVVNMLYADDRQRVLEAITRSVEQGDEYEIEFRFVRSDGSVRWALSQGKVLHDAAGRAVRMVGVDVDITDRKRAEQELQQAKTAAEAANQAKSTFLANMSHELRTPLNVILGFAQLMKRDLTLSADSRDYVDVIASNGNHLLQLINEILDLSKIEAGKLTIENQSTNLVELLHNLHSTFWQQARDKGLQLYLDIHAGVPQMILIDGQKLQQVLINLLSNAIKFTQQGQVTLRVQPAEGSDRWYRTSTSPGFDLLNPTGLRFAVDDTGVGLSLQDLDIIFEAFGQTSLGRQAQDSTGLGLAISRKLVQLMGGDISVTSQLGRGSTFQFTIPVQAMPASTVKPTVLGQQVAELATEQSGYRILVVDDQIDNRLVLVKLLQQLGLEVEEATTGAEAIAQWQHWHPHLIWMDLRMPEVDGYEATRQIRALEQQQEDPISDNEARSGEDRADWRPARTVIIALTAQASSEDQALAIAAGCDDYISKPFQVDTLLDKMMIYLGLSYVYAEAKQELTHQYSTSGQSALTAADFAVMPPEWILQLHDTAQCCDERAVLTLIDQIPPEQEALAAGLRQFAYHFDFHAIIELTSCFTTNV